MICLDCPRKAHSDGYRCLPCARALTDGDRIRTARLVYKTRTPRGHTVAIIHTTAGAIAWCHTDHEPLTDPCAEDEAEMAAWDHSERETAA